MLQQLNNIKGKRIKNILTKLEMLGELTPQVRKVILDELNDFMRDILRELGYKVDD